MHLLARLCYACYNAENIFLTVLGFCKIVEMTLKYGVSDVCAPGFTGLGMMVVAVQQDFNTATTFAEMALAMQKAVPTSRKAETLYNAYTYCLPWTKPFQTCLLPFADGYASGMRTGDTDYAMWSLLANHVWMPYIMGKRLGPILEHCPKILSQMEEVSQPEQGLVLKMFWQMILNLTTPASKDAGKLEGDIFSSQKFTGKSAVHKVTIHLVQGELLIFTDFEAAANRAIQGGDKFSKLAPGIFLGMIETFHRAVALYAMARKTKKRKYKVQANKITKTIEKWVKCGNPNVRHYHLLLSAERAALSKKYDAAEVNYKEAIVLAARTGHMHHAALCNERYADFLLQELSDEEEAKYRMEEAIRFYEEWGAVGKVEMLEKHL
jgi:predicted ATPase